MKRPRLHALYPLALLFLAPLSLADSLEEAIFTVESGGSKNPAAAVGDHGKALGWAQLHRDYWQDAKTADPSLPSYPRTAADKELSRRAMRAYWRRYGARTEQEKALLHHYGATRWRKDKRADPDGYWRKVQRAYPSAP